MFITLFLGLLIRDNALPGLVWLIVLDVLLTITNTSTSFAALFFIFQSQEPWVNNPFKSLYLWVIRLCKSCRRRRHREESVQGEAQDDLNSNIDAREMPSPASIFRFHQQASARVHAGSSQYLRLGSSSEKSLPIDMSTVALPPVMELTKGTVAVMDGNNQTTASNALSQKTVMMTMSEKSCDVGEHWSVHSLEGKNEVEKEPSQLSDHEEESPMYTRHTASVRNVLLPPLDPPFGLTSRPTPLGQVLSSSMSRSGMSTSAMKGREDETVINPLH